MNTSGKPACKEVRSRCKCIVKEKILSKKPSVTSPLRAVRPSTVEPPAGPSTIGPKGNNCKITIHGEINLPEDCCLCEGCGGAGGNDDEDYRTNTVETFEPLKQDDCDNVRRELAKCLRDCLITRSKPRNDLRR